MTDYISPDLAEYANTVLNPTGREFDLSSDVSDLLKEINAAKPTVDPMDIYDVVLIPEVEGILIGEIVKDIEGAQFFDSSQVDGAPYFVVFESHEAHNELVKILKERFLPHIDDKFDIGNYGFSDKYSSCENCGHLIKTSPSCYGWQPDFWLDEENGCYVCAQCVIDNYVDEYIAACTNKPRKYVADFVNPAVHGWTKVPMDFQNGLHHGMNSDPKKITAALNAIHVDHIYTAMPSQFYVDFNVWVHNDIDVETVKSYLEKVGTDLPYDIAIETDKALRGQHSDWIKVEKRTLTQEDFISGKWKGEQK
jgi:hypothetical protein